MVIHVQVEESFRGPMDLLLYLITRDEIDIHDIPIAHITSEYLKAIRAMEALDIDQSSEFLSLASFLMEIKSRMLLPPGETSDDEETVELDPRAGLVEALLEYKRFKEAAGELDEMYDRHRARFPRAGQGGAGDAAPEGERLIEANVYELFSAFARLMRETLAATSATTIVATHLSVQECIRRIEAVLQKKRRVSFSQIFEQAVTRTLMVVHFIAVLELIRRQAIQAFQRGLFSEIYLEFTRPRRRILNLHPLVPPGRHGLRVRPVRPFADGVVIPPRRISAAASVIRASRVPVFLPCERGEVRGRSPLQRSLPYFLSFAGIRSHRRNAAGHPRLVKKALF
ncbi:MAG: segregation/condensation protein A [Planctomycetota bacterium]